MEDNLDLKQRSKIKYIPQLNLWYDESRHAYLNESGETMNVNSRNKRITDVSPNEKHSGFNVENMKLSIYDAAKIGAIVVGIIMQFNVLLNKITEVQYKLETVNKTNEDTMNAIKSLQHDNIQLNAQLMMNNDIINSMQYKLANKK